MKTSISQRNKQMLVMLGFTLISVSIIYRIYDMRILSFNQAPSPSYVEYNESSAPTEISIPILKVNVTVKPATIVHGVWQRSEDTASHLFSSATPGQDGNIVVYAHNKPELFGKLSLVRKGDTIHIQTGSGSTLAYEVKEKLVVKPSDIYVVEPTHHEVLTLYTCTGFADSKRLVVKAYPVTQISRHQ